MKDWLGGRTELNLGPGLIDPFAARSGHPTAGGCSPAAVTVDRGAVRQVDRAFGLARLALRVPRKPQRSAPLNAVRAVKLFLEPSTACSLPSSGRLASCSSVEFPDLPGGSGQVGVIHQRRRIPLFSL